MTMDPILSALLRSFGQDPRAVKVITINLDETPNVLLGALKQNIGMPAELQKDMAEIKAALEKLRILKKHENKIPHYFWSKQVFAELADTTCKIVLDHPNTRFFGVGHSPSYVIHGMQCLAVATKAPIETGHVAFSRRFVWDPIIKEKPVISCTFTPPIKPNEKFYEYGSVKPHLTDYRTYLQGLGLHPLKIEAAYRDKGQKTAFLDLVQNGGSFTSFQYLMHEWARECGLEKEAFASAVSVIALTYKVDLKELRIPEVGFSVKTASYPLSLDLTNSLTGNYSFDTDRFVPSYEPKDWGKPPVPPDDTKETVDHVKKGVKQAILDKLPLRGLTQWAALSGASTPAP